ncbi:hypothetical protein PAPHI01_0169 [Pancytospora philotis]|nr:hypothetical protein PAPHI01_0169 [Pancytospora philotis]
MLCLLTQFIPGKTGSVIRRVAYILGGLVLLYFALYAMVLCNADLKVIKQEAAGNKFTLSLRFYNNSVAGITLHDLNLVNAEGKAVRKMAHNFPVHVPCFSSAVVRGTYALDAYRKTETTMSTLLRKHTFKNNV